MKNFQLRTLRRLFAPAGAALLVTAGCNRTDVDNSAATSPNAQPATAQAETPRNSILRTSAEPFEVLTEQAFTASWPQVDQSIALARSAAAAARNALTAKATPTLDSHLAAIAAARQSEDRPGLALAAVETYRDMVQSQDAATAQVPIAISLLDYAGFRYDALAQAPNVDWAEMDRSARFAGEQWRLLEPTITSPSLRGIMAQSIGAMIVAVRQRNVPFARSAAATELALVDLLEEQAAGQKAGRR